MYDEDLVEDSLAFAKQLKSSLNAQQANVSIESDTTQPAPSAFLPKEQTKNRNISGQFHAPQEQPNSLQEQMPAMPQGQPDGLQQQMPAMPQGQPNSLREQIPAMPQGQPDGLQQQMPAMPQATQQIRSAQQAPTQAKINSSREHIAKNDTTNLNLETDFSDIAKNTNPYYAIDSRSFTYQPAMESYSSSPLRLILAFIVSNIAFFLTSPIYIFTFNIERYSFYQPLMCMFPLSMMILGFKIVNKNLNKKEKTFILIWHCVLIYFLLQIAMCRAVMKVDPDLTFPQAWKLVKVIRSWSVTRMSYYIHLLLMYLLNLIVCITFVVGIWKKK